MAECVVDGCRRTDIAGHGLCAADYMARYKSGLAGVTAEEVARRRAFAEQRLAGSPLEQWLKRRRPVMGERRGTPGTFIASGQSKRYTSCTCECHRLSKRAA